MILLACGKELMKGNQVVSGRTGAGTLGASSQQYPGAETLSKRAMS